MKKKPTIVKLAKAKPSNTKVDKDTQAGKKVVEVKSTKGSSIKTEVKSSEILIFIDTNIYLQFYDIKAGKFKKLLPSLKELKENIFITHQIINEINRNKLSFFLSSITDYSKDFKLKPIIMQKHFEDEDTSFDEVNTETKNILNQIQKHKKTLDTTINGLINKVSKNEDNISIKFQEIFSDIFESDDNTLTKARLRKEMGNPPGKVKDSLGDQMNWELILKNVSEIKELYIVSTDSDYLYNFESNCYFNSFLYNELINENPSIKVSCFDQLTSCLEKINSFQIIKSLPKPKELDEIKLEEQEYFMYDPILSGYYYPLNRQGTPYNAIDAIKGYTGSSPFDRFVDNPTQRGATGPIPYERLFANNHRGFTGPSPYEKFIDNTNSQPEQNSPIPPINLPDSNKSDKKPVIELKKDRKKKK